MSAGRADLACGLLQAVLGLSVVELDRADAAEVVQVAAQLLRAARHLRPLCLAAQLLSLATTVLHDKPPPLPMTAQIQHLLVVVFRAGLESPEDTRFPRSSTDATECLMSAWGRPGRRGCSAGNCAATG